MKRKYAAICLKWGFLLGIALSALEVVRMFARNVHYGSTQIFELLMVILYILLLVWGGKEFKEHYAGRLSFSKAYLACMMISFVGSCVLFGYTLFHYSVVEKDGLSKKYEAALCDFRENVMNDTIRGPELEHYLDTVRQMMFDGLSALPQDSVDSGLRADIRHGLVLLNGFYGKRMRLRPAVDTALDYQLRHFTAYSRRTLDATLQAYRAQNRGERSTPYIQRIVQRTGDVLDRIDPGEARYGRLRTNVPNYTKPGTYASVSASMQLLSGMFFAIFVAMYHYRSKNPPVTEIEGNDMPGATTDTGGTSDGKPVRTDGKGEDGGGRGEEEEKAGAGVEK